jgi:O-antigen/teichoic acid export membrane protein
LTTLFSLFYAYRVTRRELKLSLRQPIIFNKALREEFKYGGLILATTGFITFLYTADMVFVKHYFSPELAGFYGGVATIARVVFFVTGSVTAVLIASVKIKESFRNNFRVLLKGLIIISLIGLGATGVFVLFPELVIKLMIGQRYLPYAYLLPKMAIVLFLVSLTNLLMMFFLALRKYFVVWISVAGTLIISLTSVLNHGSLIQIVNNFLTGVILTILLLAGAFYKISKN